MIPPAQPKGWETPSVQPPPGSEQPSPRTPPGLSTTDPLQATGKSLAWAKARLQLHPLPLFVFCVAESLRLLNRAELKTSWDQLPYRAGRVKAGESAGNGFWKARTEDSGGATMQIAIPTKLP